MPALETVSSQACFGGEVRFCRHTSTSTRTEMEFSVYLPPAAADGPVPVVYWLSGLTCTAENFIAKAGAQQYAARLGLLLVAPDTSPRGAGVPGEDDSYDLGSGAGFYVNATEPKWAGHYHMYDYVVQELPELVRSAFPARPDREAVFGHSMGGHGALVCALKNPGRYRSVSAFAPIVAPTRVPWGRRAFTAYLGTDESRWAEWDAHLLVREAAERLPLKIDQGTADDFLAEQLRPDLLEEECRASGHPIELAHRSGYDHSYYFIATFVGEHLAHHARALAD